MEQNGPNVLDVICHKNNNKWDNYEPIEANTQRLGEMEIMGSGSRTTWFPGLYNGPESFSFNSKWVAEGGPKARGVCGR